MTTMNKAEEWEDKYLTLKDERDRLKKETNEQQRVIKQMYTKLQMIDGTLSKRTDGTPSKPGTQETPRKPDKETDALIATLRRENQHLKKVNLDLREKLRANKLGQTPRRLPRTNLDASGVKKKKKISDDENRVSSLTATLEEYEMKAKVPPQQQELIATLKKRLLNTEERMRALHDQNNALRRRLESVGSENRNDHNSARPTSAARPLSPRVNLPSSITMETSEGRDTLALQRELKDKEAQLMIVKNRYDHLEAKARAAAEIHERTVYMMEEGNRTIRDLRRKIQAMQHENESLVVHQQRADDLELELASAKEESRRLEERMTALCESPFINDAFESRSRVDKLVALERTDRQQKVQIEHLKETAKMHHAEIQALKSSAEQLAKQRDHLAKENHELKLRLEQVQRGAGILEDKMRLYSGEAGIDTSDLEKALTVIKRGQENMTQVPFIESGSASSTTGGGEAVLKQKLQELQVAHLKSCRELEMTERMLKAQTSINKDLNAELNELEAKLKGSNNELLRKLDDYESLCAKRLQRIHALEAQVKQLMKRKDKRRHSPASRDGRSDDENLDDQDVVSVASLAASDSDFGPGENLVEVWIMSASLDDSKVEPGVTTFVMLDFYDYETQTSPLLTGLNPAFDFAASYRVKVDNFFLRYLSSETLTLELNRTKHADYELLGQCAVNMRSLVEGSGKMKIDHAEIISVRDGSIIGTFKICIRLALPINELFQLYLREVPGERERFEKLKLAEQQQHDAVLARAKAQNQLEVSIVSCAGLGTRSGGHAPCPFVHFQLLSFPDSFSQIVANTTDPVFDHRVPFPMLVDKRLLRYLEKEKLEINVLDDSDEISEDEQGGSGILGKAMVPLAPLAKGEPVSGAFGLRDENGAQAGSISIHIKWRSPVLTVEDVAANIDGNGMALSEEQIRRLIKRYENNGSVHWKSFLRLSLPGNDKIQGVQSRLRKILQKAAESGLDLRSSFQEFDKNGDGFVSPRELRKTMEELGFRINDDDFDVLLDHLDGNKDNKISYEEFIAFAAPPSEALLMIERKIRMAFVNLDMAGKDLERPFRKRQVEGLLSVRDFLKALQELGFELVEHELPRMNPRDQPDFGGHSPASSPSRTPRAHAGSRAEAFSPTSQDRQEEIEIEDDNQPNQLDEIFNRRKLEFQERIARASQATASITDEIGEIEKATLVRQYGTKADESAMRLQAHFRGYKTRRFVQDGKADQSYKIASAGFVEAEDALRLALHRVEDKRRKQVDLRGFMVKRDKDRSGLLTLAQFIRALDDAELGMSRTHAAALASHFVVNDDDASGKRKQVDYNEFVKFARFQARDISGISPLARNMLLSLKDDAPFRAIDQDKSGLLSRRDFKKAARKTSSLKALGSYDIAALMDIFDLECTGEVDYKAFVKFATGQPLAVALTNLEEKLRATLKRSATRSNQLEATFRRFDKDANGSVSREEFRDALRELGFDISTKELVALFSRFDPSKRGAVSFHDFVKFVTQPPTSTGASSIGMKVDLSSTQRILHNVVRRALSAGLSIHGTFEHYDWTRSGTVTREMFQKGCGLVGFPLTLAEIKALSDQFAADENRVKYREFLEWSTPRQVNAQSVIERLRVFGSGTSHGSMTAAFGHFDSEGKGEITRKQFEDGLKELGMALNREEMISLMCQFDKDGDGVVQYLEFVNVLLGGAADPRRRKAVASLGSPMSSSSVRSPHSPQQGGMVLNKRLINCREALVSCDPDFSGLISIEDFTTCMERFGIDGVAVQDYLLSGADPSSEGRVVQYKKFIRDQDGNQQFIDSVARKLSEMVRTRAKNAGGDYHTPFEAFESSEDGYITTNSFKKGLDALGFDLSMNEVHALLEKFDKNGDGRVSFREFSDTVLNITFDSPKAGAASPGGRVSESVRNVMARVLHVSRRRGIPLRMLLEVYDKTDSGKVRTEEFVSTLREIDPGIPNEMLTELAEWLDEESDGQVTYTKFLHGGDKTFQTRQSLWELEENLRLMIREQVRLHGNVRIPFTHFDRKGKGKFDMKAWKRAIEDLALDVAEQDVEDLFRQINISETSKVSFNEFAVFVKDPEYALEMERKLRKLVLSLVLLDAWKFDVQGIEKVFRSCLDGEDNKLDRHSLKNALRKLGIELTREEVVRIITRYDPTGIGRMPYETFAQFLEHCAKFGRQTVTICDRLRKLLKSKMQQDPQFSIRGHFDMVRAGGVQDKGDFLRVLNSAQLGLQEKDAYRLADCFSFDIEQALVDVDEFLSFLLSTTGSSSPRKHRSAGSPSPSPSGQHKWSSTARSGEEDEKEMLDALDKLRDMVKQAKRKGTDYRKSFEHFDKDYSGEITQEEFQLGMEQLGFHLPKSVLKGLFRKFAGGRRDGFRYRRFLRTLLPAEELFIEEVGEKLRKMIRERIEYNGGGKQGLKKTFRHFERDSKGNIKRSAFKEGLEALSFDLTDSEVRMLLDKFDLDGNGRISLEEFKAFAEGTDATAGRKDRIKAYRQVDEEADEIAVQLKALIRKAHKNGVDYRRSFEHFDPHFSGYLDAADFKRGLQKVGFTIKPEHVRALMERFAGKDGRIRYRDFLRFVAPAEEASAEQVAEKFRKMLARVGNLRKAFKHFERNRDGNITRKAFKRGMQSLNFDLTDSEVRILMDIFDEDGDGEISFDEFVDFASGSGSLPANKNTRKKQASQSDDSESGDSAMDLNDAIDKETLSFHVHKLKLAKQSGTVERVYIQYKLPDQDYVRTSAFPIPDPKKKQTLKVQHDKNFSLAPGSKLRKSVKAALRGGKCKIQVQLVGVKTSGRAKVIGQTTVDLQDILEELSDLVDETVTLFDENDDPVAKMSLTVKALDVLQLM